MFLAADGSADKRGIEQEETEGTERMAALNRRTNLEMEYTEGSVDIGR